MNNLLIEQFSNSPILQFSIEIPSISPFPEPSHSPTPPHHQWVKDTDGDDVNGHNDDDVDNDVGGEDGEDDGYHVVDDVDDDGGVDDDGDDDGYDVVDDVDDDGGSLGMWVGSVERWCSSLGRVRPDSFLLPPPDHREDDEDEDV